MKRIIIVAPGASGKDFLRRCFEKASFKFEISYTTRSPRMGEEEGKDYFFITEEKFNQLKKENAFYEHEPFGGCQYGTLKSQFYSDIPSVFIMSALGLQHHVSEQDRKESLVIFIDVDRNILEKRLRERGLSEEKIRDRQQSDKQFENFVVGEPGMTITDAWFDGNAIVSEVKAKFFKKM